jgi:hypothetical protein
MSMPEYNIDGVFMTRSFAAASETAGPFDKLRAGYSTAQFAKYRELLRSG